ncbi:MAG: TonB-dependent receptor [Opitutaceae bacterium]|nr:TonB-dependent receptor [Opitutaceae bacterium]
MTPIPQVSPPTGGFRRLLACFLGLSLALTSAWAQTGAGSISGKVTDTSGAPLRGARVTIDSLNRDTATNSDGSFHLGSIAAGTYTAHISYLGLPSRDFPVTVVAGQPASLDAKLGDEVVQLAKFTVEGQRVGQARALNQQRASDNLKSIVSSDALGRFPDQNAAETLGRIAGVSLARDQGEGRFISIRGVDPDLNNTQMNGVNIPASHEDSRAVMLDVFPADLLDTIEVVKAITPDMDGDAIGGSVNLKTQTAFSTPGRSLRVAAEGQYNELSGQWSHKASVVWGDKFNDGKLGVLIALSDAKRFFASDGSETDDNPWVSDASATPGTFYLTPGGDLQHREYTISRLRRGINFSLDFKPAPGTSYYFRGVYSHFSDYENRFRTRFRGRAANAVPTSDFTGTVTGRRIVVDLKDRTEDNNVWSLTGGGEHQRGSWVIDYSASWARAELVDPFRYQPVFQSANTTWNYDLTDPQHAVFTGAGTALPASAFPFTGWALDNGLNVEDEWTVNLNAKREVTLGGHNGHVKFGGKYRAKARSVDIGSTAIIPTGTNTLTLAQVARTSARGVNPTFASVNPQAFRAYYAANPGQFGIDANATAVNNAIEDYNTDENIFSVYGMADLTMGKLTLIGGARLESTQFENRAWSVVDEDATTLARTSADRSYSSFLPSLIARYDFTSRMVGRASVTSTLARPKFLDASASRLVEDDDVTQGNPNLKPYRATNWDASLEFYPKSLGVITVGVFHKDIQDFIFSQVIAGGAPNGINSLTIPLNGDSAKVTGFEADYQQQFTFLPSPFDGLGLYANLTLTDSESVLGGSRSGEKVPFLNQSKKLGNLALSYEKYGFFARVSLTHRSRFLSLLGASTAGDQYVEDHSQIDFSTNYKFSPRFTVYAEFLNITNEPYSAVYNVTNGLRKAEFYNWSANVGVKLSF